MMGARSLAVLFTVLPLSAAAWVRLFAQDGPGDDPRAAEAAPAPQAPGADEGDDPGLVLEGERIGAEHDDARFVTAETRRAIDEALAYLAKQQNPDGSFSAGGIFGQGENVTTAITSLACLSFVAGGNLPDSGLYGNHVRHGIDFLIGIQNPTGYICGTGDRSRIHGHGFATLLLAEVYGATGDQRIRLPLQRAVQVIENSQTRDGGWGYEPDKNTWDEASTTICQVQALRSSQQAGMNVSEDTMAKALAYVEKCKVEVPYEAPDGSRQSGYSFRYSLQGGNQRHSFALCAAGIASLQGTGHYTGETVERALSYLDWHVRTKRGTFDERGGVDHFFYSHFYAAQAMYHAPDSTFWQRYYPRIRDAFLKTQARGGAWRSDYGNTYATAIAALILQIPYKFLPIFQK